MKRKLAASIAGTFAAKLGRRLSAGLLPPGLGSLLQGKDKYILFLLGDVRGAAEPQPHEVSTECSTEAASDSCQPDAAFGRSFDEAFQRIERQRGHNFVSLVDLRRAVPVDRHAFDAGLEVLRRAGRFTLSGAEGRDGLVPEQREAGIEEDGSLLLYVSRRLS
jgi:hypothetical protein